MCINMYIDRSMKIHKSKCDIFVLSIMLTYRGVYFKKTTVKRSSKIKIGICLQFALQ